MYICIQKLESEMLRRYSMENCISRFSQKRRNKTWRKLYTESVWSSAVLDVPDVCRPNVNWQLFQKEGERERKRNMLKKRDFWSRINFSSCNKRKWENRGLNEARVLQWELRDFPENKYKIWHFPKYYWYKTVSGVCKNFKLSPTFNYGSRVIGNLITRIKPK